MPGEKNKLVAFLRGLNVGGNSLVKMSDLSIELSKNGLEDVRTYIQSGNVIFSSYEAPADLAIRMEKIIQDKFGVTTRATIFSAAEWQQIVADAPSWWGKSAEYKHNLLIMIPPHTGDEVIQAVGALKPELEVLEAHERIVYQTLSAQFFGRTSSGKLASLPIYKAMTVRNRNTSLKIAELISAS